MIDLERFLAHYPADAPRTAADEELHDAIGATLPRALHDLWDAVGLGSHREGMISLVDPRDYAAPYAAFFGGDGGGRVPFMVNGFGEPIAYRKLGPREGEVSILHTYGPRLSVLGYSLDDFLTSQLVDDDALRQVVNVPLFSDLRGRLRKLRPGECYGFDPGVLREEPEGTKADASHFEVVEALEHLELLLRRAAED